MASRRSSQVLAGRGSQEAVEGLRMRFTADLQLCKRSACQKGQRKEPKSGDFAFQVPAVKFFFSFSLPHLLTL